MIVAHILAMPKGVRPPSIQDRYRTVGKMAAAGVGVRAWCRKCGLVLQVEPAMLAAYHGADFSLINRTARCRSVTCDGEVFFLAEGHGRYVSLVFD